MVGQQRVQRVFDGRLAIRYGAGAGGKVIVTPEIAARAAKGQGVGHLAEPLADPRQCSQRCGQALFQIGLDRTGQHGGRAFGADGDGHGVTVHDGGGDKGAVVQIVDDIDQGPFGTRNRSGAGVFGSIFIGGIEQGSAKDITGAKRPGMQGQAVLFGPGCDFGRRCGGEHVDPGLGLQQQAQFGHRSLTTSRQHDTLALGRQVDWEVVHMLQSLRLACGIYRK